MKDLTTEQEDYLLEEAREATADLYRKDEYVPFRGGECKMIETQITKDFRNKQKEWKELLEKLEEIKEKKK